MQQRVIATSWSAVYDLEINSSSRKMDWLSTIVAEENDAERQVCLQAWAGLEGKKGEPKKAQRLFAAAAKAEPDNAMLLNTWASYEKRRGDAAKARELYLKALDSSAGHVASLQVSNTTSCDSLGSKRGSPDGNS